ncbi:MAG: hypothetical protein ACP6IP_08885 [Candidatus Njordarchaeia archaeon]
MIEAVEVEVRVRDYNDKLLSILHKSTNPENILAPETLNLEARKIGKEIIFRCRMDFKKNMKAKLSTIRRTVDDYIWSLGLAYNAIKRIEGTKNEV